MFGIVEVIEVETPISSFQTFVADDCARSTLASPALRQLRRTQICAAPSILAKLKTCGTISQPLSRLTRRTKEPALSDPI